MVASIRAAGRELSATFSRKLCPPVYDTIFQNPFAGSILRDFCWRQYMSAQPDLTFASADEALQHLVYTGYCQGRVCFPDRCKLLDPDYYRRRYPELKLDTDARTQFHYCYIGYYENRLANAETEWLFNADLHVYQQGKVGSHAIAAALEGRYQGSVLHMHWPTDIALYYPHCSLTYAYILGHARETPVKVISGARELVSRAVSGAFQYLDTLAPGEADPRDAAQVIAHLEDTFLHDCDVVAGWFDHHFFCNLDIYEHQFDHQRGFVELSNDTVRLFLYRYDKFHAIERDLGQFVGLPELKLAQINVGKNKSYSVAYKEVMENLVIPRQLLKSLYDTRYMRFFFTDVERERLIDYWSSRRILS
jgi:hypothetical protein